MRFRTDRTLGALLGTAVAAGLGLGATAAKAQDKVVMAVPAFLTGAGAPAFGIPAKNGAELIIKGINDGTLPAPYNSKGLAGRQIQAIFYDEAGGGTKQVTELRNKVQKQNVDIVVGYISSGTCAAVTRVAEELKVLTIETVCGTPRVFEELDKNPKYVFRTMNHATGNNVSAALYVAKKLGGQIKGYVGLNQNYAWGQDSWRDFDLAMKTLAPNVKAASKQQFPKLFSGQYGAEISALLRAKQDLVHSSFWGGDLEAFFAQGTARGLFKKKKFVFTVGETVAYRLGKKFPEGLMVGTRGPYGMYVVDDPTPLNQWFQKNYRKAYGEPPSQPSYQFAQGVLAAKYAYDKAATDAGSFPTTDQVIKALEGATYPTFVGNVEMALSNGHQAITDDRWGVTVWDDKRGEMVLKDIEIFPARCVMPPAGVGSIEWLKGGMKGAKC
ncbi:MAG: ABC transporter substrate-binding protein [Alphaproteobacteria bacterium]|nr:ABC transporter substrate-binding protein [Alphaproteobacteria bacterium]